MISPVSVVVASLGRPQNLLTLLSHLSGQSRIPAEVILSLESEADCPTLGDYPFRLKVVTGPRGMTAQRNRGLDQVSPDSQVVIFYDDDFVPSRYSIEGLETFFATHPEVGGATGELIADGIIGAGISPDQAAEMVKTWDAEAKPRAGTVLRRRPGLYGCNMAFRVSMIGSHRFDEDLPLYAWLEDVDFSARIGHPMVLTDAFTGVHCGEKRGREASGVRLGYSQICNPVYLLRKGTLSWANAVRLISRALLSNVVKGLRPDPWVDRKGRRRGNLMAIGDVLRGHADPRRILSL